MLKKFLLICLFVVLLSAGVYCLKFFSADQNGKVGIVFWNNGEGLEINYIAPNSPAAKAGIKINDAILAINFRSTKNMSVEDAMSRIRGRVGTIVLLKIKSWSTVRNLIIKREKIEEPVVKQLTDEEIQRQKMAYKNMPVYTSRKLYNQNRTKAFYFKSLDDISDKDVLEKNKEGDLFFYYNGDTRFHIVSQPIKNDKYIADFTPGDLVPVQTGQLIPVVLDMATGKEKALTSLGTDEHMTYRVNWVEGWFDDFTLIEHSSQNYSWIDVKNDKKIPVFKYAVVGNLEEEPFEGQTFDYEIYLPRADVLLKQGCYMEATKTKDIFEEKCGDVRIVKGDRMTGLINATSGKDKLSVAADQFNAQHSEKIIKFKMGQEEGYINLEVGQLLK